MAICYHCGKKIDGEGVPHSVGGNPVTLHKGCRRWYRTKPLTANVPDEPWESVDGDGDERG